MNERFYLLKIQLLDIEPVIWRRFVVPASITLDRLGYKKIRDMILIKLINFISNEYNLNYTKEQRDRFIVNYILSTAHLQDTNNHINILVPNVFIDYNQSNKLIRVDLGKRKVSYFIKKSFNNIMLNHFNENYLDYKIKSHKETKKLNSQYSYKLKEVEQKKDDMKSQINNMKYLFESTNVNILKIQKRVDIYLNRMDTSIIENDKSKFEKNRELVLKNIEKIKEEIEQDYSNSEKKADLTIFDKIKSELQNNSYTKTMTLKR